MLLGLTAAESVATSLVVVTITALAGLAAGTASDQEHRPHDQRHLRRGRPADRRDHQPSHHRLAAIALRRAFSRVVLAVAASALFFPASASGTSTGGHPALNLGNPPDLSTRDAQAVFVAASAP